TCFVLTESEDTENYIVKQHSVEIVHQKGDRALVRGTLQPGDRIAANGIHRLVPGQQVSVNSDD
ncbi:MAG: efflux transporter periplasmic adaptor subunit, partial [Cyanobacteria bacterium J06623_1]